MRSVTLVCLVMTLLNSPPVASGETLQLRTGGHVQGRILNIDEYPRSKYIVETDSGATITLTAEQVKHVIRQTPAQEEYDRLRPTVPDTAEGHWRLATWCTENRLLNERQHHLEKVIEHDPNHGQARWLLGYRLENGQWLTRADIMQARGYIQYDGDWRTVQDVAIRERKKKREAAELQWRINLRRWHGALTGSDRAVAAEAQRQILAARDVHAAPALVDLLEKEPLQPIRKLLIDALDGNPAGAATAALLESSIKEPDRETRERAMDAVLRRKHPNMVRQLAEVLESNNNIEVNRAASLLGALGYESAISPLIDALITLHKFKVGANQPQIGATFSPGRGGGLSFGGRGPKIVQQQAQNHDVLSALVKLSAGQNFAFDTRAWRAWFANTQRVEAMDLRRD